MWSYRPKSVLNRAKICMNSLNLWNHLNLVSSKYVCTILNAYQTVRLGFWMRFCPKPFGQNPIPVHNGTSDRLNFSTIVSYNT